MLQNMIHPTEQEDITSPIAAQILDFCDDDGDFFSDTLRTSDVASCFPTNSSGGDGLCCYVDDASFAFDPAAISALLDAHQSSYPDQPNVIPTATTYQFPATPAYIGDHQQDQFDQVLLTDAMAGGVYSPYSPDESVVQIPVGPAIQSLPSVYEDECFTPMPGYVGTDPSAPASCSFLDATGVDGYYPDNGMGFFSEAMWVSQEAGMGAEVGGGVIYGPESVIQRVYSSGDMQVMRDSHHLVGGCGDGATTLPTSDISALDESTFKVGRLSVEERKEKIHRYMKKRNERNFSKKIKYACRKTLADSRPRVRGRFAKHDEFGEATARPSSRNLEYYEDEEVVVKEEEDTLNSSDILAHISGVNSFKYSYTLESWI